MGSKINILFLPGLGADERMYNLLIAGLEARFGANMVLATHLAYPEPRRGETMAEFAARLWREAGIKRRRFDFIVGCSFGGMLAQELIAAGPVRTPRLILISTAFTGSDIGSIAAGLARVADLVPCSLHRFLRDHMAAVYPLLRIRQRYARELAAMIKEMPAGLLFYAAKMIRTWRVPLNDGVRLIGRGFAPATLFVMGGRDPLISPRRVRRYREADLFFEDGDHFIALTKAEEIAAAMKSMS